MWPGCPGHRVGADAPGMLQVFGWSRRSGGPPHPAESHIATRKSRVAAQSFDWYWVSAKAAAPSAPAQMVVMPEGVGAGRASACAPLRSYSAGRLHSTRQPANPPPASAVRPPASTPRWILPAKTRKWSHPLRNHHRRRHSGRQNPSRPPGVQASTANPTTSPPSPPTTPPGSAPVATRYAPLTVVCRECNSRKGINNPDKTIFATPAKPKLLE
jgi:hypothetical protein